MKANEIERQILYRELEIEELKLEMVRVVNGQPERTLAEIAEAVQARQRAVNDRATK